MCLNTGLVIPKKFLPQKSLYDTFYGESVKKIFGRIGGILGKTIYYCSLRFSLRFIVKEEHGNRETTTQEKNGHYFN